MVRSVAYVRAVADGRNGKCSISGEHGWGRLSAGGTGLPNGWATIICLKVR